MDEFEHHIFDRYIVDLNRGDDLAGLNFEHPWFIGALPIVTFLTSNAFAANTGAGVMSAVKKSIHARYPRLPIIPSMSDGALAHWDSILLDLAK